MFILKYLCYSCKDLHCTIRIKTHKNIHNVTRITQCRVSLGNVWVRVRVTTNGRSLYNTVSCKAEEMSCWLDVYFPLNSSV